MQTLTSRLRILVDDRHVIESTDGQTLWLRTTDGSPLDPDSDWDTSDEIQVHTLAGVAGILDSLGVTVEHPRFDAALKVLRYQFGVLVQLAQEQPARPFVAVFCYGHFKVQWHPPKGDRAGHWTFAQPFDPRLEVTDTEYIIEQTDDLLTTAWNALERTLVIAGADMHYDDLGNILNLLAQALSFDPHLARPKEDA
ncbi:MAG: hypothetical protein QM754_18200 [Tepidisphaeraceae bacterium]